MGNSTGSVSMDSPEGQFVQSELNSNCVVVFSKTYCSFCRATKQLFSNLGVNYKVIELDKRQDGNAIQDILGSMTGARSVPRVFINGRCIGGNSETQELNRSGKLQELLQQCGKT